MPAGRRKGARIGPYGRLGDSEPGAWLNHARVDLRLTMADFAAATGISRRTIQSIESGKGNGYRVQALLLRKIDELKAQAGSGLRNLKSTNAQVVSEAEWPFPGTFAQDRCR